MERTTQRGGAPLAPVIILYFTACRQSSENVSSSHDDKASATGCSGLIMVLVFKVEWEKRKDISHLDIKVNFVLIVE